MFDINAAEALVLLLLALVLLGPSRLPKYAEELGRLARRLRRSIQDTKGKVEGELGLQRGDIDWDALDPRQYDPRRIVRDAWDSPAEQRASTRQAGAGRPAGEPLVVKKRQADGDPVKGADGQG